MASSNGEIVSVIAVPAPGGDASRFAKLTTDIIGLIGGQERGGHPVPPNGPNVSWVPAGLDYELRAASRKGRRLLARFSILAQTAIIKILDRTGRKLGRLDLKLYRADVVRNSDFRKFDDGLKLTVDLDPSRLAKLESVLQEAEKAGIARFGLHRQKDALMTCLVPSPFTRDHFHFIDGAAGGYAMAASFLKSGHAA